MRKVTFEEVRSTFPEADDKLLKTGGEENEYYLPEESDDTGFKLIAYSPSKDAIALTYIPLSKKYPYGPPDGFWSSGIPNTGILFLSEFEIPGILLLIGKDISSHIKPPIKLDGNFILEGDAIKEDIKQHWDFFKLIKNPVITKAFKEGPEHCNMFSPVERYEASRILSEYAEMLNDKDTEYSLHRLASALIGERETIDRSEVYTEDDSGNEDEEQGD